MIAANKKRILLVEDDSFLSSLIARQLSNRGYEVMLARDADEALTASTKVPDFILLDLVLPGMGGFELVAKMHEKTETKDVSFLVISNSVEQENRQRAFEMHAAGYLVKAQTTPTEIVDAVDAFFASRGEHTQQ